MHTEEVENAMVHALFSWSDLIQLASSFVNSLPWVLHPCWGFHLSFLTPTSWSYERFESNSLSSQCQSLEVLLVCVGMAVSCGDAKIRPHLSPMQ